MNTPRPGILAVLIPSIEVKLSSRSDNMDHSNLAVHPAEFWATNDTIQKINKRKLCLASMRADCEGGIIEAHTIPRSQLHQIAVDGQVNYIKATPGDLLANDGRFTVGKRGVGQFSVLNLFCAKHDQEVFTHIENDELVFDRHQLALLHYRAMAAELYKKINAVDSSRYHLDQLRKCGDAKKFEFAKAFAAGNQLGLRDITRTFSICETILRDGDYSRISGLAVLFKKKPTIMTVGGFSPEFDYAGKALQRLGNSEATYEQVGMSILATEGRACVVLTWISGATICRQLADSFITQNDTLLTTLAIQTAFEHIENTCMNIPWWDSLRPMESKKLLERMQFAGSPFQERSAGCLGYCGITFDQWDYDSHKLIE
jgi:hypothetical protein